MPLILPSLHGTKTIWLDEFYTNFPSQLCISSDQCFFLCLEPPPAYTFFTMPVFWVGDLGGWVKFFLVNYVKYY